MKNLFTKERLIKALIIVSVITVFLIGLNQLRELSSGFLATVGNAAKSVIIPFSIAFLLSFIIGPLANMIENKTGIKRNMSVIIAVVLGILLVIGILSVTLTFIISQLISVTLRLVEYLDNEAFKGFIENVIQILRDRLDITSVEQLIENFENYGLTPSVLLGWFGTVFNGLKNFTSSLIQIGFMLILTPVFMYYLIKDKNQVFNGILHVFPEKSQKHIQALGLGSDEVIRGYFTGYGIVMLFITIFFAITYSILSFFVPGFNILYAVLFALIMGVFAIIPYIGVWIGMAMPIVLFMSLHLEASDPGYIYIIAIAMILILNIVEEAIESTLVQPKVYSKQVRIHPLAVLSSFIFFGAVFGLVGFILAVPIAGMVKVTFKYFKDLNQSEDPKLEDKNLEKEEKTEKKETIKE
ncbi:AI-2E family transporter [Mycoplasmatota bacterium]|nr:AI-2E family transporter [Mycoplasmatota bacterium]